MTRVRTTPLEETDHHKEFINSIKRQRVCCRCGRVFNSKNKLLIHIALARNAQKHYQVTGGGEI
jgi:hypothetical protein